MASKAQKPAQIIISLLTGLSSLWSHVLPTPVAAFIFPPAGPSPIASATIYFLAAILAMVTALSWEMTPKRTAVAALAAVLSLSLYFSYWQRFVLAIPIPQDGTSLSISIGTSRTETANACCARLSDFDLLKNEGPYEEQVQRLWTRDSINSARSRLVFSFALFVGTLALTLCGITSITIKKP